MLKGIPSNVSSALLKALADMGHGDTIVIADHFYPAATMGAGGIVIDAKGNGTLDMLRSILQLIPLDVEYEEYPVKLMKPDPGFEEKLKERPALWDAVRETVAACEPQAGVGFVTRTEFYEHARRAYITLSTSEEQPYGCVILQKGVC